MTAIGHKSAEATSGAAAQAVFIPKCLSCAYDLSGLPDGRCPECGAAFTRQELIAANQVEIKVQAADPASGSAIGSVFSLIVGVIAFLIARDDDDHVSLLPCCIAAVGFVTSALLAAMWLKIEQNSPRRRIDGIAGWIFVQLVMLSMLPVLVPILGCAFAAACVVVFRMRRFWARVLVTIWAETAPVGVVVFVDAMIERASGVYWSRWIAVNDMRPQPLSTGDAIILGAALIAWPMPISAAALIVKSTRKPAKAA